MHQNLETQWPALGAPASDGRSLDIWGFFQRRKSFVIVFAVLGAGLGYLLFQQKISQYRSVARVEVIQRVSESVLQGLLGKDMLADAMFVIPSPDVLQPAYKNLSNLKTLQGLSEGEAVSFISRGLTINQLSQGIIEIQFVGPDPQDATRIVNAVAEEYIDRQRSSFESETEKLAALLEKDKKKIEDQLQTANDEHKEFIEQARLLATYDTNQSQSRLSALSAKISLLDIEEAELTSRLSLFNKNLGEEDQRAALLVLIGKELDSEEETIPPPLPTTTPTPDAQSRRNEARIASKLRMSQALLPLVVDAAVLEKKVGAGHPRLLEVQHRIELVRREYAKMDRMLPDPEPEPEPEPEPAPLDADANTSPDYLKVFQQALTHELDELRAKRTELRKLAETAEQQAYLFSKDQQSELQLRRKIELLEEQYSSIATKIGQTELNTDMSGVRAEVIMPASAGNLVYPILYRFLGFGGFLGAIAGLGLGYLVELADRSFRKPDEVVREFGVPILGHVPYMKTQQKKKGTPNIEKDTGELDPTLVCAHLPRSRPAEAYRSVRTTVCFTASGDSPRVLQVTSPAAGDGKSTLAANLAISLAQSGKNTILVESDFRRPNVHKLMGVPNTVGIVDVLREQAELSDAIQSVAVDQLSVLPCGKRPGNPSELLTRPEYEALLEVLREKFEYVVVDSPPILVVADSSSVAPRVDAVIMCIRLNRHTRDMGRRAFDQLRDIGANVVGMVINGVEQSDAYGYGAYNYSDYRSYANPYAYKYAYHYANEAYFSEGDDPDPVKRLIAKGDEDG